MCGLVLNVSGRVSEFHSLVALTELLPEVYFNGYCNVELGRYVTTFRTGHRSPDTIKIKICVYLFLFLETEGASPQQRFHFLKKKKFACVLVIFNICDSVRLGILISRPYTTVFTYRIYHVSEI